MFDLVLALYILFVAIILYIILALVNNFGPSRNRHPPGPFSFPLIGPRRVEKERFKSLLLWSKKLKSPIIGFQFFPGTDRYLIALNSYDSVKEMFLSNQTAEIVAARPPTQFSHLVNPGLYGILMSEGPLWREQRRFSLHILRDFGLGRDSIETIIRAELEDLIAAFEAERGGSPFNATSSQKHAIVTNPSLPLIRSVANVICAIVFGHRMGGDAEFARVSDYIGNYLARYIDRRLFNFLLSNFLIRFPGDLFGLKQFLRLQNEVLKYLKKKLEEHKRSFDETNIRDFIDSFLLEMKQHGSEPEGQHFFVEQQLIRLIFDLFSAGMETTSTTLRWAMLIMAHHPEIQKRIRDEIHEHLGHDRLPCSADRAVLRYTDAALNEVQRFATIVPGALPHTAIEEFTLFGYRIPKSSVIITNLYGVHHDPALWPDPDHFNPEANFLTLDSAGKIESLKNTEYLVPFGVGKRSCLGESLARQELWIFFVGLLQRFEVRPAPGHKLPSESIGTNGLIRAPFQFTIELA